jgi:hypothetical protein
LENTTLSTKARQITKVKPPWRDKAAFLTDHGARTYAVNHASGDCSVLIRQDYGGLRSRKVRMIAVTYIVTKPNGGFMNAYVREASREEL